MIEIASGLHERDHVGAAEDPRAGRAPADLGQHHAVAPVEVPVAAPILHGPERGAVARAAASDFEPTRPSPLASRVPAV